MVNCFELVNQSITSSPVAQKLALLAPESFMRLQLHMRAASSEARSCEIVTFFC
jgi:hypothetical protein